MIILTLLSAISLFSFVIFCVIKNGVTTSFSANYYLLKKQGYLFQLSTIIAGILLMPVVIELSIPDFQVFGFMMCAGIIFVGFAPRFKENLEKSIHFSGAITAAVCSVLWGLTNYPYLAIIVSDIIIFLCSILYVVNKRNTLALFAELFCFLTTYIIVFYVLLTR